MFRKWLKTPLPTHSISVPSKTSSPTPETLKPSEVIRSINYFSVASSMASAASNHYIASDENAPQDALSYMALWSSTGWQQTDSKVASRFEDSNQHERRSPGRDGIFALEHRGLGVSPLERGFQARAC
ncbi:hypothetical protein MRX96_028189 [Rhipicephalus microplus]